MPAKVSFQQSRVENLFIERHGDFQVFAQKLQYPRHAWIEALWLLFCGISDDVFQEGSPSLSLALLLKENACLALLFGCC